MHYTGKHLFGVTIPIFCNTVSYSTVQQLVIDHHLLSLDVLGASKQQTNCTPQR
jgi:hypothetical protein